jgi:hypothetical protein
MIQHRWIIPLFFLVVLSVADASVNDEELSANQFLSEYEKNVSSLMNEMSIASWNYETNITDFNAEVSLRARMKYSSFKEEAFQTFSRFNLSLISDPDILRQLNLVGVRPLEAEEEEELTTIIAEMGKIYGSSKVCPKNESDNCLSLEPDLSDIMAESQDFEERTFYWKEWRRIVGQKIKPKYERYVELKNKKAKRNGFSDCGDEWQWAIEIRDQRDLRDRHLELVQRDGAALQRLACLRQTKAV